MHYYNPTPRNTFNSTFINKPIFFKYSIFPSQEKNQKRAKPRNNSPTLTAWGRRSDLRVVLRGVGGIRREAEIKGRWIRGQVGEDRWRESWWCCSNWCLASLIMHSPRPLHYFLWSRTQSGPSLATQKGKNTMSSDEHWRSETRDEIFKYNREIKPTRIMIHQYVHLIIWRI